MTKEQIAATINAIGDLMQALRHAATEDKAEIYAGLKLQLTYNPGERAVAVSAGIGQTCTKGSSCPRTESPGTYIPAITGELVLGGQR